MYPTAADDVVISSGLLITTKPQNGDLPGYMSDGGLTSILLPSHLNFSCM